jgi:hypothetical protein
MKSIVEMEIEHRVTGLFLALALRLRVELAHLRHS